MFQRKFDEILKNLSNKFGIADDILVVGYELMVKTVMTHCENCFKYADR